MRTFRVYSWIGSFLRPYSAYMIFFLFICLLSSLTQLSLPFFVEKLIDQVIPNKDIDLFFLLLGVVLLLYLLGFAAQIGKNSLALFCQEYPSRDFQMELFCKIRSLGFSYYEKNPIGETLALIQSSVADVQRLYREYIPSLTQTIMMFVVFFIYLVSIHFFLSMILIASFVLYYLVGPYFERRAAQLGMESIRIRNTAQATNYNVIASVIEIKANTAELFFLKKLMGLFSLYNHKNILYMVFENAKGGVRRVFVYLGFTALFLYGFGLVGRGSITTGEFIVFVVIYARVMMELTQIITQITELKVLNYQASEIYNVCHEELTISDAEIDVDNGVNRVTYPALRGKIEFDNVTYGYSREDKILDKLSFTIYPGEHVAIVSKSGGGKSTIVKMISRFYEPHSGEVRIDDIPLKEIPVYHVREHVTYAFQDTTLFCGSIFENIQFARPEASRKEVIAAAQMANVHEYADRFPEGYDTLVGDKGNKLSGGQKQRISLARVFLKDSPIIILDEITSALDNINEGIVNSNLKMLRDKTVITIAHRPATMRSCDRILVLDQGRIVEQGTYEELLNQGGYFSEIIAGES